MGLKLIYAAVVMMFIGALDHSQDCEHRSLRCFMAFILFTFITIFLLIASGGLLLFYREAMLQRIGGVINPRTKQANHPAGHDSDRRVRCSAHGGAARRAPAQEQGRSVGGAQAPDPRRISQRSRSQFLLRGEDTGSCRALLAGYRDRHTATTSFCILPPWGLAFFFRISGWATASSSGRNVSGWAYPMCST